MNLDKQVWDKLKETKTFLELSKELKNVEELGSELKKIKIGFSSNIIVDPIKQYLQKYLYINNSGCEFHMGNYDSHIDNSQTFAQSKCDVVIFDNLFDNLSPGFESKVQSLSKEKIELELERFEQVMSLSLQNVSSSKYIIINKMFSINTEHGHYADSGIEPVVDQFNDIVLKLAALYENCYVIDPSKYLEKLGTSKAIDTRYYYKFKAPWKYEYVDLLAKDIVSITKGANNYFYKALVLDCDNTLWGGIIGEDLVEGIKLSPFEYPGNIYWRIQNEIKQLQQNGVIICLCSKNNAEDVDEVLEKHGDQVLQDKDIVIKKVNWESKVKNISEISEELNIGKDSIVFVDDSDFEIQSVQSMLPEVKTFQVPKKIHEYPSMMKEIKSLFLATAVSSESLKKTDQYKKRSLANNERKKHANFDDYLVALDLKITIKKNDISKINRISELTLKSNQFNLTTLRCPLTVVEEKINSNLHDVVSVDVSDKFGQSGLTGIAFVKKSENAIIIENFLMSCRVIGRKIEYELWYALLEDYMADGYTDLSANYIKSQKNNLVVSFYDDLGLKLVKEEQGIKQYKNTIEDVLKNRSKKKIVEVNCEY